MEGRKREMEGEGMKKGEEGWEGEKSGRDTSVHWLESCCTNFFQLTFLSLSLTWFTISCMATLFSAPWGTTMSAHCMDGSMC